MANDFLAIATIRERARRHIEEHLIAERVAIESYGQMIRYLGEKDPTTRTLLESILAVEEEHAQDLSSLLGTLDPPKADATAAIDPTVEDDYWRAHFAARPYVKAGQPYESFQPAYRRGWEARGKYGELNWEHAEPDLRRDWHQGEGRSGLSWEVARQAARDAWDRLGPRADYSADNR